MCSGMGREMDALIDKTVAELELEGPVRSVWEPVLSRLGEALKGDPAFLLAAVESVGRSAGLSQSVPMATLLEAFTKGGEQIRSALTAAADPGADRACRRLLTLERAALPRLASGYSAGLEETIARLRREATESSPVDESTGAMKSDELLERLELEVNRCQRMDLSLGLLELAFDEAGGAERRVPRQDARPPAIGERLRDNLRRYDSIGLTCDGALLLVLPDISRRGLAGAAERLRREIVDSASVDSPAQPLFALAHYDFVDVNAGEMLASLQNTMREARRVHQPLTWS